MKKLPTGPYKGVRDFYPEDMFVQKFLFDVMSGAVESFGYTEYGASILESSEIYKAKTGEEIVQEQTYSFEDRGGRDVTLRPEMTPTVARMVASKWRDLPTPIRWYSIPNLFRYENPQRGRLREHFQLNVDLLGIKGLEAEIEIISIAHQLMKDFGAQEKDFEIRINSRKIINNLYKLFNVSDSDSYKLSKILDKKEKISQEVFKEGLERVLGDKAREFESLINSGRDLAKKLSEENDNVKNLITLIESLSQYGIKNVVFSPTLVRGFDYYTDIVFEIYDTDPQNKRSLFGGGRYDGLLDVFGVPDVPAVGFGMGDVTLKDFLETRNLIPEYRSPADLYICRLDPKFTDDINKIAGKLRDRGVNVSVDLTQRKIGDQIKVADKQSIPYVVCVGEDELKTGEFKLKNLKTGEEETLTEEKMAGFIKKDAQ